jgi:hypothetical protein
MKLMKVFLMLILILILSGCKVKITLPESKISQKYWFGPNFRSVDYFDLFRKTDEWQRAREKIHVFKFYQQQFTEPRLYFRAKNELYDFINLLKREGKEVAVETGAIKEYSCRRPLIEATSDLLNKINPDYIAIDSSFLGVKRDCSLDFSVGRDLINEYIDYVKARGVKVGLIEPYPYFDVNELKRFSELAIDFFHVDLDFNAVRDIRKVRKDMEELSEFLRKRGIKFGIIYTGSPTSFDDRTFIISLFNYWDYGIQHTAEEIIFQSWHKDLPRNLPENENYTFTNALTKLIR